MVVKIFGIFTESGSFTGHMLFAEDVHQFENQVISIFAGSPFEIARELEFRCIADVNEKGDVLPFDVDDVEAIHGNICEVLSQYAESYLDWLEAKQKSEVNNDG